MDVPGSGADPDGVETSGCARAVVRRHRAPHRIFRPRIAAETLGDAGFVFTIPERCTPASHVLPTAQEVAQWVAVIERLCNDPKFEAEHRRRALAEAKRSDGERLARQFEDFFQTLLGDRES